MYEPRMQLGSAVWSTQAVYRVRLERYISLKLTHTGGHTDVEACILEAHHIQDPPLCALKLVE
jgi:hypothetical protein